MGFAVPGLDDLRLHLAASGVGDVHLRVDAPGDDGTASASAHDALPAATWPYPLDPRVSLEALRAPAEAERARARRLEDALANARRGGGEGHGRVRLRRGRNHLGTLGAETEVAPTLPPRPASRMPRGEARPETSKRRDSRQVTCGDRAGFGRVGNRGVARDGPPRRPAATKAPPIVGDAGRTRGWVRRRRRTATRGTPPSGDGHSQRATRRPRAPARQAAAFETRVRAGRCAPRRRRGRSRAAEAADAQTPAEARRERPVEVRDDRSVARRGRTTQ